MRIKGNDSVKKMIVSLLDVMRNDIRDETLISKLYSLEESFKNDESSEFKKTSVMSFLTDQNASSIVTQRLKKKFPTLHRILFSLIDDYARIELVIGEDE